MNVNLYQRGVVVCSYYSDPKYLVLSEKSGLPGTIHSMAFEHDDGGHGWVIVLPIDDYSVKLTGYATGPYTLTMTKYSDQGEPEQTVIEGYTEAGVVETFALAGAAPEPTPTPTPAPTPEPVPSDIGSGDDGGGGGSIGLPTLLALMMLSLWVRRRAVRN